MNHPDRDQLVELVDPPTQPMEGGRIDGGQSDLGQSDGGQSDGGQSDGGQSDGGQSDGGRDDCGQSDGGQLDIEPIDAVPPGRIERLLERWGWWQDIGPVGRASVAVSTALVCAGVWLGVAGIAHTPRISEVSRPVESRLPQGADALGCPAAHLCTLRPAPRMARLAGPIAADRVLAATETVERAGSAIYRRELVVTTASPPGRIRVVSQCRPDAESSRVATETEQHSVDPSTGAPFAEYTVLLARHPRCSTLAQFVGPDAEARAAVARIRAALRATAANPAVQADG